MTDKEHIHMFLSNGSETEDSLLPNTPDVIAIS